MPDSPPIIRQLQDAIRLDRRTQRDLAEIVGIHENTLSRFARQGKGLGPEALDKLAAALGKRIALVGAQCKGVA